METFEVGAHDHLWRPIRCSKRAAISCAPGSSTVAATASRPELYAGFRAGFLGLDFLAAAATRFANAAISFLSCRSKERGVCAARLRTIKADIAANLCDCELSVSGVATRHGVTPRYVQKLFAGEGVTFSEFVLDQRLAVAHQLLSDPRFAR